MNDEWNIRTERSMCPATLNCAFGQQNEQNFNGIKNKEELTVLNGEAAKEKIFLYALDCLKNAI